MEHKLKRKIRAARAGKISGFTLLELVITLGIALLLATIALPGLVRARQAWALWGGARMVETSLQWGRMRAIAANTPVLLEIVDEGRRFVWKDPESGQALTMSERTLGAGIRITSAPRAALRFYPRGNAAPGGTYRIENATGSYSVVVTPGGRIRFQKN